MTGSAVGTAVTDCLHDYSQLQESDRSSLKGFEAVIDPLCCFTPAISFQILACAICIASISSAGPTIWATVQHSTCATGKHGTNHRCHIQLSNLVHVSPRSASVSTYSGMMYDIIAVFRHAGSGGMCELPLAQYACLYCTSCTANATAVTR